MSDSKVLYIVIHSKRLVGICRRREVCRKSKKYI